MNNPFTDSDIVAGGFYLKAILGWREILICIIVVIAIIYSIRRYRKLKSALKMALRTPNNQHQ